MCAQSDQPRENKVVERAMAGVRATPTKRVAAVAVAEASGTRPWLNAVQFPPRDPVTVVRVQVLINVGREPSLGLRARVGNRVRAQQRIKGSFAHRLLWRIGL